MANADSFPTTQIDVKPGDETGVYYITFCNFPFNSTWQELKDWFSGSCIVDFIEVFSFSSSGWIRLQGKKNFETVLAYIKSKHFKDRPLFIDARNKTETIKIRTRETGPKPKGVKRYSHPTARSQSRRTPSRHYGRQKRFGSSSNQVPLQASVSTPRSLRTPGIIKMNNGAVNASNVVEMMAYNDFWTISAVGAFLHKPLVWPYYPPTLVFPSYGWTYCCGTSSCAPYPFVYARAPMPLIPEQEAIMPESVNDDIQSCLDEPQSAVRGRRVQSIPPSFRWAGNETFE